MKTSAVKLKFFNILLIPLNKLNVTGSFKPSGLFPPALQK